MNSSDMELFLAELEYKAFDGCYTVDEDENRWTGNGTKSVEKNILDVMRFTW